MLHSDVRKTAGVLGAVFAAAAVAFVFAVAERPANDARPIDAARTFELECAKCHAVAEFRATLRVAPDRTALALEWLELLRSHGSSSERADVALVKWIFVEE